MKLFIDYEDYDITSNEISTRITARGIIKRGETYLLIVNKYGEYQFPGGGVDEEEELFTTLIREVEEETGYLIEKDSIQKWGLAVERRKGMITEIFDMESHYFFCDVKDEMGTCRLEEYEKAAGYQPVWVTLEEAIEKDTKILEEKKLISIVRDLRVMEMLTGLA